jgi:hypothetical protein
MSYHKNAEPIEVLFVATSGVVVTALAHCSRIKKMPPGKSRYAVLS